MKKRTRKKLIIMAVLFIGFACMYLFATFSPDLDMRNYSGEMIENQRIKNLRSVNKRLREERISTERKITALQESIKELDFLRAGYTHHIPKVKESITAIQKKKEQAITDNDFAGYVSQDSMYMDSVAGLISLYESVVEIQNQKSAGQDSIISSYIEKEKQTEQIFQNDITIIKSRHQLEIDELNHKLKKVKRQRNISLIGNAALTAFLFWKK